MRNKAFLNTLINLFKTLSDENFSFESPLNLTKRLRDDSKEFVESKTFLDEYCVVGVCL